MNIICITGKRGCGDALSSFIENANHPFNFYVIHTTHGIKQAHVDALAKARSFNDDGPFIIIEDHVLLSSPESLSRFMAYAITARNSGADIVKGEPGSYLAGGMYFYVVLNDTVSFDDCPNNRSLNKWIGENYRVATCQPMIAVTRNGWNERLES